MKKNDEYVTSKKKIGIRYEILEKATKESVGFVDWIFTSYNNRNPSRSKQGELIESKGLLVEDHILIPFSSIYEVSKLETKIYDKYAHKCISYK